MAEQVWSSVQVCYCIWRGERLGWASMCHPGITEQRASVRARSSCGVWQLCVAVVRGSSRGATQTRCWYVDVQGFRRCSAYAG